LKIQVNSKQEVVDALVKAKFSLDVAMVLLEYYLFVEMPLQNLFYWSRRATSFHFVQSNKQKIFQFFVHSLFSGWQQISGEAAQ
jgi:hypothetical protein